MGKPGPTGHYNPNTFLPLHQGSPRHGGLTACTHSAPTLQSPPPARRPAGPSGSLPQLEGGGVGHSRQRVAHGPTVGPAHTPPLTAPREVGAGCSAHALLAAATAHSGGAAAGGSSTPRLPLRSLEKTFSLRAHHPSPRSSLSFGPTEVLHEPPSPQLGVGRVCSTSRQNTNTGASAWPGQSPHPVPCKASPISLSDKGNGHASPTTLTHPPREPLTGHTPPWWGPKEDTRVKGNTTTLPQAPE